MWTEAVPLALGAAIYPPALLALLVLMRRPPVAQRGLAFLTGAFLCTFLSGVLILTAFGAAGVHKHTQRQLGAGVDIAAGVLLLFVAWIVARGGRGDRPQKPKKEDEDKPGSGLKAAFALGFVMYTPSLLWVSAVKQVAASGISTAADAAVLAFLALLVVSMSAIPVVAAIVRPEATLRLLARFNELLQRHGRRAIVAVLVIAGGGLLVKGVVVALG